MSAGRALVPHPTLDAPRALDELLRAAGSGPIFLEAVIDTTVPRARPLGHGQVEPCLNLWCWRDVDRRDLER